MMPAPPSYPTADALADHLTRALGAERYAAEGDPAGVWIASERPVRRLGLRVEAGAPSASGRYGWAEGLDALLIHRPFGLWPARLPEALGVLAYHRALDDHATLGYAPPLAHALGLCPEERPPMEHKGRPIGLVAALPEPTPLDAARGQIVEAFGGLEAEVGEASEPVAGVALMGAMTAPLLAEAAARGAQVYVTGQLRPHALAAARDAGLVVLAIGHARAEAWGLRYLGGLVRERWPAVELVPSGPGFG